MLTSRLSRPLGGTLSRPLVRNRHTNPLLLPHGLALPPPPPASAPSGRRHVHFIQASVETAQQLITTLHATAGTPWYVTLPLVALAVNLARLPFTVYAQRVARGRVALAPLLQAWQGVHARQAPPAAARVRVEAEQRRLLRERGLQTWRLNGGFLVLPVWLTAIEAIRRLCGGPRGLLGSFIFGRGGDAAAAAAATAGSGAEQRGTAVAGAAGAADASLAASPDAVSAALAESTTSSGLDPTGLLGRFFRGSGSGSEGAAAAGAVQGSSTPTTTPASALSPEAVSEGLADPSVAAASAISGLDPSLATGGALWFPDLTAADPYYALPGLLSVVLVYNLLPHSMAGVRNLLSPGTPTLQGGWTGRLRRALLLVAASVGVVTMDMPAALHLYWLCSAMLGGLMTRLVAWRLPLPKTVPRCNGRSRFLIMPRRP